MKQIFRLILFIFSLFLVSAISACSSDEPDNPEPEPAPTPDPKPVAVRRTVLVYIVATNNLGSYNFDTEDINEMLSGSQNGAMPDDARWLIYHAPRYKYAPRLIEICDGDTTTLKQYEKGGSVTLERMTEVFDDMADLAPASHYGLVLWSHASGWLVNGIDEDLPDNPYTASPLSFGNDNGEKMNLSTLRAAIKGRDIDYVYFDACHMAGIETAYELRDATDYLVCSPAETPGTGMPYDLNMSYLADGSREALINAASTTFDVYEQSSDCTMTVIDMSGLERLADATARIYDFTPLPHPGENVTNYYGTSRQGNFCDFGEYVNALAESEGVSEGVIDEFNAALEQAVAYKAAPETFYSDALHRFIPIYNASGLSTYVFNESSSFYNNTNGYYRLQWAKDVVSRHLHE